MLSITIQFDYRYDTSHFFDSQQRIDLLNQAATNISSLLNDQLSAIVPSGSNTWEARPMNPSDGTIVSIPNLTVPANTIIVFVGGRNLSGSERGEGGAGGYRWTGTTSWGNIVSARGQVGALSSTPTDFGPWGGSISFDTTGVNWYFGSTTDGLTSNQDDFYSVALHELGHVLGIGDVLPGTTTPWSRYVSNGQFVGPNAEAAHGAQPVPLDAFNAHWAAGTTSNGVEAAMTPTLVQGTRKLFTALDFAGLQDIGWQVSAPSTIQFAAPSFSIREGDGQATITLVRSSTLGAASVKFNLSGITATPGIDFQNPVSTTVSFANGQSTASFPVPILDNGVSETTETLSITLSQFVGATPGSPTSVILSIIDNDHPDAINNDFDGDRRADIAAYDPAASTFYLHESAGGDISIPFGQGTLYGGNPVPISGDFDGDGLADVGVFQPDTSTFFLLDSSAGSQKFSFGQGRVWGGNPIPITGDFDGDGRTDVGVYQPGPSSFFIRFAAPNLAIPTTSFSFGKGTYYGGSPIPITGDFDGDGLTDTGVYQTSTSSFALRFADQTKLQKTQGFAFGQGVMYGGQPMPITGDFDGDGLTDVGVYQPSSSSFALRFADQTKAQKTQGFAFGQGTMYGGNPLPVSGDFDGDGHTGVGVYQLATGTFALRQTTGSNVGYRFTQQEVQDGGGVPLPPSPTSLAASAGIRVQMRSGSRGTGSAAHDESVELAMPLAETVPRHVRSRPWSRWWQRRLAEIRELPNGQRIG